MDTADERNPLRLYVVFSNRTGDGFRGRVIGPFRVVRQTGIGCWGYDDGEEPVRVAMLAADLRTWEVEGFPDDPGWEGLEVIGPDRPTSATELEAALHRATRDNDLETESE
jgi:hypothetical protein